MKSLVKIFSPSSFWGLLADRVFIVAIFVLVYDWFDRFNWIQPFTNLICFAALAVSSLILYKGCSAREATNNVGQPEDKQNEIKSYLDLALGFAIITYVIIQYSIPTSFLGDNIPASDLGTTTYEAAYKFFVQGDNPYVGESVKDFQKNTAMCYGPVTFLGYAPSLMSPHFGIRRTNVFLLIISFVLLAACVYKCGKGSNLERISGAFFAVALSTIPFRLWYELFIRGSNDLIEPILFLLFLLSANSKKMLFAGVFTGLALSSKIVFGVISTVSLLRRRTPYQYFVGFFIGISPLLAFALWDLNSFYKNFIRFQFDKTYDFTSLYSITPIELHWIFPTIAILSILAFINYFFNRSVNALQLGFYGYLLLLILEACNVEVHLNHLIWIIPLSAMVMANFRGGFIKSAHQILTLNRIQN